MAGEQGLHDAVDSHISAGHAVRINASPTLINVNGTRRDGVPLADNSHQIVVSTKNEALVTAIADAILAEGL